MTRRKAMRATPAADASVSLTKLSAILTAAAARGVPVEAWRSSLGLAPGSPRIEQHVPMSTYLEVWARAIRAVRDPAFPLEVAATPIESLNLVGLLIMTSATLGDALQRGMRFERLWVSDSRWEIIDRSGDERVLAWSAPLGSPRSLGGRAFAESALAAMILGMRALSGRAVLPLRVTFAHAAPERTEAHERLFGVAPSFDGGSDTLTLPADVATWRIQGSQPAVASYLEAQCVSLLEQLEDPADVAVRLRRLIMDQVHRGLLSRANAAKQLGMSERSLLRRLAAQGTTFREVFDDVRCLIAHSLLGQGHLSALEVAAMTGFASPSAFHRAYRRWRRDRLPERSSPVSPVNEAANATHAPA